MRIKILMVECIWPVLHLRSARSYCIESLEGEHEMNQFRYSVFIFLTRAAWHFRFRDQTHIDRILWSKV